MITSVCKPGSLAVTNPYADPLRVVQITDTHLHAEPGGTIYGVDVDRGLDAVLERLGQEPHRPELILATGDLVHDAGEIAYRRLRDRLQPLGLPVYCLPGNHDLPGVLEQVLANGPVRRERQVVHGPWQFLLLDSTVPGETGGRLAPSELDFLDAALGAEPERHSMICLHHHPVPIGSPWMDELALANGPALFAVLDRYPQVRAVVWGHIHQEFSGRRRGMALLGTPSTCAQFAPERETPQKDDRRPGYRWFELYPDGTLCTGITRARSGAG